MPYIKYLLLTEKKVGHVSGQKRYLISYLQPFKHAAAIFIKYNAIARKTA